VREAWPATGCGRCAIRTATSDRVGERTDLLKTLAEHHDLTFDVFATVERPGRIAVGDPCAWL
jgi:uncharacterized protein YcbX